MRQVSLAISIAIAIAAGIAIRAGVLTTGEAAIAAGVAALAWFGGYLAIASLQAKRFNAESATAMELLGRGEHDRAAELWGRWTRGITVPAVVVAAARHDVAWVTLRRGQPREALALFAENERRNLRWLRPMQMDSVSALDRALCHGLLGELELARHALAEAGMRSARAHGSYAPMQAFVEAVLACREGRAASAAKQLAAHGAAYESQATGDVTRPLRVVRAFAIAQIEATAAAELIAASRPAYPGEYAFLGGAWPEMAAFLASHEL